MYQEAIQAIKNNYPPSNYTILREGLDLAIKALEKQIPKQINIKINEFKAEDGYCPNCNERIEVAVWASEYCYECGQKLDWN